MVGKADQRGRIAATERGRALLLRGTLVLICFLAIAARLNKVVRFGNDLHDLSSPGTPLFDLRAARELAGGAVFPPSMQPVIRHCQLQRRSLTGLFRMAVDLQYVCAAIVPVVSAPCCIIVYALGKEVSRPGRCWSLRPLASLHGCYGQLQRARTVPPAIAARSLLLFEGTQRRALQRYDLQCSGLSIEHYFGVLDLATRSCVHGLPLAVPRLACLHSGVHSGRHEKRLGE